MPRAQGVDLSHTPFETGSAVARAITSGQCLGGTLAIIGACLDLTRLLKID